MLQVMLAMPELTICLRTLHKIGMLWGAMSTRKRVSPRPPAPQSAARHPLPAGKKPTGFPAWGYGVIVFVVVLGAFVAASMQPNKPPAGMREVAPGLYEDLNPTPPLASPGARVKLASPAWGFDTLEVAGAAARAERRHRETAVQFAMDNLQHMHHFDAGATFTVVDVSGASGGDYYRVRPDGSARAWWVHVGLFEN